MDFLEFCKELEAEFWGESAKLMELQLLQLKLRLEKTPSSSFRPVKSAKILWQFWASSSFGVSLAHDGFAIGERHLPIESIIASRSTNLLHLEEALPEAPPATATATVRNAYTRRVAEQQEVACLMLAKKEWLKTIHRQFLCLQQEEGNLLVSYDS
ncbi:hypothetical protein Tco_0730404 [Tanacetum coccineum]|uniref:Uncharacterized protein n=1 Tax=Tanacetum coccineum TaxID=301880 RepID=A0ABQ4YUQ4_9ASTR